jgi:hypothetical protein
MDICNIEKDHRLFIPGPQQRQKIIVNTNVLLPDKDRVIIFSFEKPVNRKQKIVKMPVKMPPTGKPAQGLVL